MQDTKSIRLLFVLAVAAATNRGAQATEFVVQPGGASKVVVVSKAPMDQFEVKTDRLEGRIEVDPSRIGDKIGVHLEVDLASLDSGIAKRNVHMHERHLETAKFPQAIFDGATVAAPGFALEPGKPTEFEAEGTFTVHGVSRPLRVRIEATYRPDNAGGRIEFRVAFPIALADYAISRPQFLFLKLAETQDVRVSGIAVAAR